MTLARSPVMPKITRTSASRGPPFACPLTRKSFHLALPLHKTRWLKLGERVDRSRDDEAEESERDGRLNDHRVLGAEGQRHDVRRAESRCVRETEVQVVEEHRSPFRVEIRIELLREGEVDGLAGTEVQSPHRPAAVHQPVE